MKAKPNVLFILTDDQRYDTIHAINNSEIITPNLDKLANSGAVFTHAHIPGGTSGAVCMPSRAMINSGKTLFHLAGTAGEEIPKNHITMGECFKSNGYETVGIGKWHNGTESYSRSFCKGENIFFGGMWDHWNVPVCDFHENGIYEAEKNFTPDFQHCNQPLPMICDKVNIGVHSTDLFTKSAIDYLQNPHEKPFFMYLSFLAPHDPRTMPKRFRDMYNEENISLPDNFLPEHPFYYGVGEKIGETRDEDLANYPRSEKEIKSHIADYYAMITHIDENVGRIIDTLKENGEYDNTIIVFTGDNGLAVGQHGLMGKQSIYDHSVRVPLILGGGLIEKSTCDDYVYLLDIYPTLCKLCGINIPESVEGLPFASIDNDKLTIKTQRKQTLFLAYTTLARGIKNKQYKLIKYRIAKENSQLFDIKNDIHEKVNLYNDPKYSEIVKSLEVQLKEYMNDWDDLNADEFC